MAIGAQFFGGGGGGSAVAALADHIADTTDAHDASAISVVPAGSVTTTDVQAALEEVAGIADDAVAAALAVQADLAAHITDTTAAHAASSIGFTPAGNTSSTTVQAAIQELQGDIDTLGTSSHAAVTIGNFDTTPNTKGLSLVAQAVALAAADSTNPGGVSISAQAFGGEKRFGGGVHVGATSLGASEIFSVVSTTKGALSAPAMTTAQRDAISSPGTGIRVYNTNTKRPEYYDGTLWQAEQGSSVPVALTPAAAATPTILGYRQQIQKISGSGGAVTLTDLSVSNNLDGDELLLLGTSDTNTVTVVSATNTVLNGGSCLLTNGATLTLVLVSAKWYEKARSN